MRNMILIGIFSMVLIGCSKDGSKNKLVDGGTLSEPIEMREPTDKNFPGPDTSSQVYRPK